MLPEPSVGQDAQGSTRADSVGAADDERATLIQLKEVP